MIEELLDLIAEIIKSKKRLSVILAILILLLFTGYLIYTKVQ